MERENADPDRPDESRDARTYLIGEVAAIAGVSVRTLRFYDSEGLLVPVDTTAAGYRLYGRAELFQLQQILFFPELGFSLKEIRNVLGKEDFERLDALVTHRKEIVKRVDRLRTLIRTIDRSIEEIRGGRIMSEKELYNGFDVDAILDENRQYEEEVAETYDPEVVAESKRRTSKYSKEDWGRILKEGDDINKEIAKNLDAGVSPDSVVIQKLVERHFTYINDRFYICSIQMYAALGETYLSDHRFTETFEKIRVGLAEYIVAGIRFFCRDRT
jgi:MerR family transcriptional regulator, multidrug-efflux activator